MKFRERLKSIRKEMSLTQEEVSSRLSGISRAGYARYESEDVEPSFDNLMLLADLFEVTTDYLLGRTDDRTGGVAVHAHAPAPTPAPPTDQRVLEYLARLERKLDSLADEIAVVKQTTSGFADLALQIEEHDTDIRLIKKVLIKE